MKKIFIVGAVAMIFSACRPSIHVNQNPSAGPVADFSNYLAIGNSLTAGYTDGSLTVSGQLHSYPAMLFGQFALIPPPHGAVGPFIQPLVSGDWGYPKPKYILGMTYNPCIPADSSLAPIPNTGSSDSVNGDYHYASGINNNQINNVGVPGIRAVDYKVAGYAGLAKAGGAPYAYRFYNNLQGTPNDELVHVVGNLHPTFFTMWLGANDVLSYALAGGQGNGNGTAVPILLNFYGQSDISPLIAFDSCYDLALNTAISTGASGALINIPDITSIPFFTTVPANGLTLARQGQADTLTMIYASIGVTASFSVGANYFMIQDNAGLTRQAVPGELILMTVPDSNLTCHGWGAANAKGVPMPIPNNYVLTTDEIQNIRNATTSFNAFIQQEASVHHLAYVDMNSYFKTLSSGITYDGIHYTPSFVTGGAFSLDGIHPTQRGYALIANQIISTINAFYKSNVPSIDVNQYKGVVFP